jgi:hypothetical protein
MDVKNENLYVAMKAYVAALIEFITRTAKAEADALSISQKDNYFATSWMTAHLTCNPAELPEYYVCLKELNDDPEISRQLGVVVGTHRGGASTRSAESMLKYLYPLGKRPDQYAFDPERFDREYLIFEETFYSDRLQFVAIAPLQGVLLEDRVITLSDKLEIKRLDKEEMEPFRAPQARWNEEWCGVRAKYELPKVIGSKTEHSLPEMQKEDVIEEAVNARIEEVINALRLYGMFDVYHSGVFHLSPKWLSISDRNVPNRMLGSGIVNFRFGPESDAREFPLLWSKLQNPKVKKTLDTAVRRFGYSCVRHGSEDRIIDLMIAAEALFLQGKNEGEKSFRLALRAAYFLGTNSESRKQVYDRMRKAYGLRSKLVHGANDPSLRQFKVEMTEKDKLIDETSSDLFNALHKAINIISAPQGTALDNTYWENLILP